MWLCKWGQLCQLCQLFICTLATNQMDLSPVCEIALHQGDAWNIHSLVDANERILNIAMPEYSAEYWVTCVDSETEGFVHGSFPEWAEFASISIYDMSGNTMNGDACHSDTYGVLVGEEFTVSIGDCVGSRSEPTAVVARYYGLMNDEGGYRRVSAGDEGGVDERPTVTVESGGTLQPIANCPRETSDTISNNIGTLAQGILEQVLVQPSHRDIMLPFHTVPMTNQVGLFPNDNSVYLVKFVNVSETESVELVGRIACPASPESSISFYGISVANTRTSETDDSLSWQELGTVADEPPIQSCDAVDGRAGGTYRVRVEMRDSNTGIDAHTHTLYWNPNNDSPVIVVRFMLNPANPVDRWRRFLLEHIQWVPTWMSLRLGVPAVHVETV